MRTRTALLLIVGAVLALAPAGAARPGHTTFQSNWDVVSARGTTQLILDGRWGHDYTGGIATTKADVLATWRVGAKSGAVFPFASIPTFKPGAVPWENMLQGIKGRISGSANVTFGDGSTASCKFAFASLPRLYFSKSSVRTLFLSIWKQGADALFAVDGQNPWAGYLAAPQCETARSGTPRGPDNSNAASATFKHTALVVIKQRKRGKKVVLVIKRVHPVTASIPPSEEIVRIGTVTERATITLKLSSAG
jgi:hypothetical protein